ncbi:MAG: 1-(5-phosphoribosyl)-5-[(5-phosphoribosylamino)methylideneamino]imidazole-4-carboxamide isomerase [Myxococcales bacterium]|nr:1-(5-phosphoribosyl)-5-[(5-phosphoribosylamino)methylideneamino]imidazole-4-carboxamide isomerase [Myxococcales bacterium]
MELIPSIDLLDGKVVRLAQGDYDRVTVYSDDPVSFVKRFHEAGVKRLHVVDLEGARSGAPAHAALIESIIAAAPLVVQVGGGIRTRATADAWFSAGAARVVVGTAAIRSPDWVRALATERPEGVVIATDARDGEVAVEGWLEGSGRRVEDLAREVDGWGVAALLYTNISRDGTREGPDLEGTVALQRVVDATVIASGGVGELDHLRGLAKAGVRASVCGRALYSGAFTIDEALEACRC